MFWWKACGSTKGKASPPIIQLRHETGVFFSEQRGNHGMYSPGPVAIHFFRHSHDIPTSAKMAVLHNDPEG